MDKRKLQAVINRIQDDVNALETLLKSKYEKREQLDVDVIQDQYGNEVVDVDAYHIDLEIDNINGSIGAYEDVLKRLNMLKESINK
jgi:hypothetical protein